MYLDTPHAAVPGYLPLAELGPPSRLADALHRNTRRAGRDLRRRRRPARWRFGGRSRRLGSHRIVSATACGISERSSSEREPSRRDARSRVKSVHASWLAVVSCPPTSRLATIATTSSWLSMAPSTSRGEQCGDQVGSGLRTATLDEAVEVGDEVVERGRCCLDLLWRHERRTTTLRASAHPPNSSTSSGGTPRSRISSFASGFTAVPQNRCPHRPADVRPLVADVDIANRRRAHDGPGRASGPSATRRPTYGTCSGPATASRPATSARDSSTVAVGGAMAWLSSTRTRRSRLFSAAVTTTAFTELVGCEVPIQSAPDGRRSRAPSWWRAVTSAGAHGDDELPDAARARRRWPRRSS